MIGYTAELVARAWVGAVKQNPLKFTEYVKALPFTNQQTDPASENGVVSTRLKTKIRCLKK